MLSFVSLKLSPSLSGIPFQKRTEEHCLLGLNRVRRPPIITVSHIGNARRTEQPSAQRVAASSDGVRRCEDQASDFLVTVDTQSPRLEVPISVPDKLMSGSLCRSQQRARAYRAPSPLLWQAQTLDDPLRYLHGLTGRRADVGDLTRILPPGTNPPTNSGSLSGNFPPFTRPKPTRPCAP